MTHPEVTRGRVEFFMTIPEAVHLVLQAASLGDDSETLILDMGEPMKIDDVARHMVEKSGRDIRIVHTGLRPGEKMHEELIGERPKYPLITHVRVKPPGADEVAAEAAGSPLESLTAMVGYTGGRC